MKQGTRIVLGAGVVGLGGYVLYRTWKAKASRSVQAAGLVAEGMIQPPPVTIIPDPLLVSPEPLLSAVPQPTWIPRVLAAYVFKGFLDAYARYATHRLPFDLTAMRSYTMRIQGAEYAHFTREDLWTTEQLRMLAAEYTWEYVPQLHSGNKTGNPEHVLRADGSALTVPGYAVGRETRVRDILTNLLHEVQTGYFRPMPCLMAVMLPWYTKASSLLQWHLEQRHTNTLEWVGYWQGKGLQIVPCGRFSYPWRWIALALRNVPPAEGIFYCAR